MPVNVNQCDESSACTRSWLGIIVIVIIIISFNNGNESPLLNEHSPLIAFHTHFSFIATWPSVAINPLVIHCPIRPFYVLFSFVISSMPFHFNSNLPTSIIYQSKVPSYQTSITNRHFRHWSKRPFL